MTSVVELRLLADRVEAATGPDRELDCVIAVAALGFFEVPPRWEGAPIGYGYIDADGAEVRPGQGGDQLVRHFTTSLDAAMTLVPEGAEFLVSSCRPGLIAFARGPSAVVGFFENAEASGLGSAATPALALCAAALRAQASTVQP